MRISDWSSDVCSSDLLADLRSVAVEHRGAFAHRLAPVDAQPDTLDDRALLALDQDTRGTGEIRFLAPPLARDREAEIGHARRRLLVEIVAVERQPLLQPQRIARAQPDRVDLGSGDQRVGEGLGVLGRKRTLEPALRSEEHPYEL